MLRGCCWFDKELNIRSLLAGLAKGGRNVVDDEFLLIRLAVLGVVPAIA